MPKKTLIPPQTVSTEALELAHELLEIAEGDLRASRTLHGTTCFPQAVFYLQQAVEKIGKAYGLAMGLAEPKQLQREWSHNTLKHAELFADYGEQQGLVTSSRMAPDEVKAFINSLKDPDKMTCSAMSMFAEWALSLAKERETYKKQPKQRQNDLEEMTRWAVGKRTDPAEVAKATALAEFFVDMTMETAFIMPVTMVLGMATAPHAVIARYPAAGTTPSKRYAEHHPVVRALPMLCALGANLAVSVRAVCVLEQRLNTIMAMPGSNLTDEEEP